MTEFFAPSDRSPRVYRTREEAQAFVDDYKRADPSSTAQVHVFRTDAEPLYCRGQFMDAFIWTDGTRWPSVCRLVQAEGGRPDWQTLAYRPEGMTDAGARLLTTIAGADGVWPEWTTRIRDVREVRTIRSEATPGGYQGPEVTELAITLDGGETITRARRTVGYSEGYACDFYRTVQAALHAGDRSGWEARECLECGAVFDEPGHVEPGEMGCDRCNSEPSASWKSHLLVATN